MADEQYPWESQTMLIAFLGTMASLAASFGLIQLSVEQIAAIGTVLFPMIAALRKWSGGEKIVMKKAS
ncbi:hypothetical protein M0R72_19030 [Candidatus Pacearchaeota archaeon]|nr:hypothetical protein [Candidatus Pacearchaeota archaeon]